MMMINYLNLNYTHGRVTCEYDPNINRSDGMEQTPDILYLYTSFYKPTRLGNNSLILMDRKGITLDCISAKTIKKQKGYEFEQPWQTEPAFFNVKLFEDDIMIATMQKFYHKDLIYMNDFIFIFMDMNFNPIPGTISLFMSY